MSTHSEAMGAPAGLDHCPFMPTYGAPAVRMVRGEGVRLWDEDGREYLDFLAGIAVVSLGHANPEIADAIAAQACTLVHVSNLYGTVPGTEVALTLDRLLGGGGQIFFTNSGAEANEAAIKLARKWGRTLGGGDRYGVVSAHGSFHGRTLGALHATGQPAKWEGFGPLPEGFRHVDWNDLDALSAAIDDTVAAVLLEPLQGEGGVNPATAAYMEGVRRVCDEHGVLFMIDEVQTGLGRTGEWFGFQHFGIEPDVVTLAKALGNGMPIGACWARREVAAAFSPGDHGTTYGGQPLAASAARAVLAIMERDNAPQMAERAGSRLRHLLEQVPGVASVRGLGLLLGAQLEPGIDSKVIAADALAAGLIVNAVTPDTLRFAPPLIVSDDEIEQAVAILTAVLAARSSEAGA
jgi:predicted acetylornithine/succinylornithine family transaminase